MGIFRRKRVRDANGRDHDAKTGQYVSQSKSLWDQPRGQRIARLQKTAQRESEMVDRVDTRLRFGTATNGWWFIPPRGGGKHNWVRQKDEWTKIRGYWYKPGTWTPVVPPRSEWASRHEYPAPSGTPMTSVIPDDVWEAAGMFRGERREERAGKHGGNETTSERQVAAWRKAARPVKRTTTAKKTAKKRVTKSVRKSS